MAAWGLERGLYEGREGVGGVDVSAPNLRLCRVGLASVLWGLDALPAGLPAFCACLRAPGAWCPNKTCHWDCHFLHFNVRVKWVCVSTFPQPVPVSRGQAWLPAAITFDACMCSATSLW